MKIFLDMDGVLADFDKALLDRGIVNKTQFIHKPRSEWSEEEIELDRLVVSCMNEPRWFRDLPVMPGAHDLWKTAYELSDAYVLTARPKNPDIADRVTRHKREWIHQHLSEIPDDTYICCLRHEKEKYAMTCDYDVVPCGLEISNILVDDLEANIEAWEQAGGIGILFKNSSQAINDLKKVFNALD